MWVWEVIGSLTFIQAVGDGGRKPMGGGDGEEKGSQCE